MTIIAFVERMFESKIAADRIIKKGMYCLRIYSLWREFIVGALSVTCIGAALAGVAAPNASDDCQIGAYRFPDGEIVDIAPSERNAFRWRKFDGSTGVLHNKEDGSWTSTLGWTDRPDGTYGVFRWLRQR